MSATSHDPQRRVLLQTAASIAVSQLAANAAAATTESTKPMDKKQHNGKPGEFDFLSGSWKISHRRLKNPTTGEWDVFEGEATCWSILGGVVSVEELRIPARNFSGMGLRTLDVENRQWSDFWVNGRNGVLAPPGVIGGFENGVGLFVSDEEEEGKPIKVRGIWDNISAATCRWQQAASRDGGKTWEDNWIMDWVKTS
ncbi:hypothetical protein ACO0LC_12110 [Undibacterium sp. JH2W]|uniref:hypothetical protein n=1 Tax=Undibacterium sp. JH2W TaxID=3413037 RepID=UPI003BF05B3E